MRPVERLKEKVEIENLWLAVLSLLKKKNRYGRELRALIKKQFDFLSGTVTAYKVLYSLETGGYVKSEHNGKYVVYSITPKGRAELKAGRCFLQNFARHI